MITIQAIPALKDNYIWLLTHVPTQKVIVVDPGDAKPILNHLKTENLELLAILITHHHPDHTHGIKALLQHYSVPVYCSGLEQAEVPLSSNWVDEGDQIAWESLGIEINVLAIPGHTHGHVAYLIKNALFTGDTLFTAGCGRVFGGTALQLYHSLCKIAALPDETEIYCGHEYTQANLRFALTVEPNNTAIKTRLTKVAALREKNLPTVPELLRVELQTNPFLRCHLDTVKQAVHQHCGEWLSTPADVFAAVRKWKDDF